MTDRARVERIADYLDTLARTRGNLPPLPPEIEPRDLDEAYAAQEILHERWSQTRGPVVGYKIAITTKVMQDLMGIGHPCAGAIFNRFFYESPVTIQRGDYVNVAVECEIAMRLGEDLPGRGRPHDRESVADAFVVRHPEAIAGQRVLLIDDVFTTGATVSACAFVLKEAGAGEVFGLTVARPQARR